MFPIVPCIKSHLPWKFHENSFSRFSVMLPTARQTEKATDNDENMMRGIHQSPVDIPHKGQWGGV